MQNYKMTVAYDGTDFYGWQVQPDKISICSTLQDCFLGVFKKKVKILGASRTDTGVHALGQVASFKTDLQIEPENLTKIWNDNLPKSILIKKIEKVSDNFKPLVGVKQKTYYYHLFLKRPKPFVARYGWYYEFIDLVDLKKLKKALHFYIGEHDFKSFCKIEKGEKRDPVKIIDSIKVDNKSEFFHSEDILKITIKGKSFLRYQIRRMIGYALDVARRPEIPVNYIKNLLDNPNTKQKLLKADSMGLCLGEIIYE
ncbi:MAG: tRNA pseudouridine(38-40) synthase TruA [bacterium]